MLFTLSILSFTAAPSLAGGFGDDNHIGDNPYVGQCRQGAPRIYVGMGRVINCPDHHVITAAEDLCRKSIDGSYVMNDDGQRGALRSHGGNVQWDPSTVRYHSGQYRDGEIYRAYCSVRFYVGLPSWHKDSHVDYHSVEIKNVMSDHIDRMHLCLNWKGAGIRRSDRCRELTPENYLKAEKPYGLACDWDDPQFLKVLDINGVSHREAGKFCHVGTAVGWR